VATVDDPGAYTKPFDSHRIFTQTGVPFLQDSWVCSVRENQGFFNDLYAPATSQKK
jgi:hypothetical protein